MNIRKLFVAAALTAFAGLFFASSCKKSPQSEPLEPISLVQPDSPTIQLFAGDSMPIQVKFTTDRPINWILGLYNVDTLIDSPYHIPKVYPDTVFYKRLYNDNPRENLYTYSGGFRIPDSLIPFSVVRFKFSFQAGDSFPKTGQNYPVGTVGASKEFTVNIR